LAKSCLSGEKFSRHLGEKLSSIYKWKARKVMLAPKTKRRLACRPFEADRRGGGIAAISSPRLCVEGDSGFEQANLFLRTNPPLDDSDQFRKDEDLGCQWGAPAKGDANFALVQHFIHRLAPQGMASFVLPNGSMSSNVYYA
jgi:hypothetical protein